MEKVSFRTDKIDGDEHIMSLKGINPVSIAFNSKTKEFFVNYEKPKKTKVIKKKVKKG